ncbi:AAA domain-containing protein [Candidatus Woesearchaeota archaeon]|nr:AAA domain-containing protein [Candidatus Woesearchaeota archaeon]
MIHEKIKNILLKNDDPFTDILGQQDVKNGLRSALLMRRNVIIVGPAGVGKTTLAKNIAKLLPGSGKTAGKGQTSNFVRVQGSPDLTVEDLMGDIDPVKALKFGPTSKEAFTPGKIFKADKGVLFFDELNRCPEKLQNALLQVLEERKVTLGGYDVDFDADFIFIATMNPEDSSTEKLSDVLLDRFDVLYMDYPDSVEIETGIVTGKANRMDVQVDDQLSQLMVLFVRVLRESKDLEKKPGVRASLGLFERSQSNAALKGKDKAEWSDAEDAIISVLSHRIKLKPSIQYLKSPEDFIREELKKFSKENRLGESQVQKTEKGGGP